MSLSGHLMESRLSHYGFNQSINQSINQHSFTVLRIYIASTQGSQPYKVYTTRPTSHHAEKEHSHEVEYQEMGEQKILYL
jgi:hypothetical protein